jgi:hypothetical protein
MTREGERGGQNSERGQAPIPIPMLLKVSEHELSSSLTWELRGGVESTVAAN